MTTAEHDAPEAELRKAVERFGLAVSALALGDGSPKERLLDAWVHLLAVQAHDIPEALREQFREMESVWLFSDAAELSDEAVEEAARSVLLMEAELLTVLGFHARDLGRRTPSE